jgi:hypothetical protein
VWALASPELRGEIEAAQERAVDAALGHAVEFVPMVRRRLDRERVVRETPAELLATSWRHTTARAVPGRAPDPQLHSHVVLHGAVRRGDQKVVAIESRAWLVHQRELGAAYRAQLASELHGLGFEIQTGTGRGGRYFELQGVPETLLEAWSGRHRQVREQIDRRLTERLTELRARVDAGGAGADAAAQRLTALERSGQLLPAEQRQVAMSTRTAKGSDGEGVRLETAGDLDRAWWATASEHGFDARSVQALRDPERQVDVAESSLGQEHQLERRIVTRLTEFDATFAPREARAVALEAAAGGDSDRALVVLEHLRERGEILELADGRQTTRAQRGKERAAVMAADRLAISEGKAIAGRLVDQQIIRLGSELIEVGAQLAPEQAQAVRVACSERQLSVIIGQAGTGKSTALTGVARAHQAAGQRVVVTSTGAQAAERLATELSEAGVRTAGCSTMALRAAVARGSVVLSSGVTVIHDEAALASTREQAWLLEAVAASGVRLIEVGDPRQSQAVGAGGLWPQIEKAAAERGGLVELSRIVRARDAADRRDQARWRAGEHDQALEGYATRGRVLIADTQQQAEDRALEAAHEDRRAGHTTLVVVQTSNEQLDGLNARAQALRVQDGLLTGERSIALAGRPYGLRAGDEVVLRAASVHPQLGAVRNGTRGRVLNVAGDQQTAVLEFADGRQATWERSQLDAASARLAYVSHTFPAQGQTVDRAHVIAGEHADANGTYVALTRAREHTRIYASRERLALEPDAGRDVQVAGLAQRLGRTEVELPSIAVPLAHEQQIEVEHARELATRSDARAPDPSQVAERPPERDGQLAALRSERDRLRAVLDSYPVDTVGEIARLEGRAGSERELADGDGWRAVHWQGVYEQFGVFGRRGREGREARDRAEQFAVRAERQHEHADQLQTRARALAEGPDGPNAWEQAHPDIRERLVEAETRLAAEVDQRAHQSVAPAAPGEARGSDQAAHDQLSWLRLERDRLGVELDGYPRGHAHAAQQADRRAKRAVGDAQAARDRAARAERELEQMGWVARHGQRGTHARERQQAAAQQADHHEQRADAERQAACEAREQPGGPVEWERAHPGVRDRLAVYEHALEVASEQQTRRALMRDPAVAMRVLGSRPRDPEQREIWDQGARAISAYRLAYQITDQQHVLGPEPDRANAHGLEQHADWEHAARLALQARRELGVGPDRGIGPVAEHVRHVAELTPTHPDRGHDHDLGFGR